MTAQHRELSLHHLAMQELSPVELVEVAGMAGFENVCAFVQDTDSDIISFSVIDQGNKAAVRAALKATGVKLYNAEIFYLTPATTVAGYRGALELAAELGARRATALVSDDDDSRAADNFAAFCDLAGGLGIAAGLEFMVFTSVRTLDHAVKIIRAAGHPNGSLAVDMLHLIRNGSSTADLAAAGKDIIGYIQLCDGPATIDPAHAFEEALFNRMAPGAGEFPLLDLLDCLPEGRCLSLEVPMDRLRAQGQDALARARLLQNSARSLLRRHAERPT